MRSEQAVENKESSTREPQEYPENHRERQRTPESLPNAKARKREKREKTEREPREKKTLIFTRVNFKSKQTD